jgi:hypothetical protein
LSWPAIAVPICCIFYVHAFELALQLQWQNIDFMPMLWVTVIGVNYFEYKCQDGAKTTNLY